MYDGILTKPSSRNEVRKPACLKRVAFWENSLRFFTMGHFWANRFQLKIKRPASELRHALFLVFRNFANFAAQKKIQCEFFDLFCAAKFAKRSKEESIVLLGGCCGADPYSNSLFN